MRIACQVMAAWLEDKFPGQKSSRVYVERRDDGTVALRLPGQGEMRLSPEREIQPPLSRKARRMLMATARWESERC